MAVTNQRVAFFWPGLLLQQLWENRLAYALSGYTLGTVALNSAAGYRQLSWGATKGGNTDNWFYVLSSLAATELAQALYWVQSPGWNFIPRQQCYAARPAPLNSFAACQTFWQQNYVAYKQALIDNWTTAFISSQTVHAINYGGNQGQMAAASYQITTDSWVYVDVSYCSSISDGVYPNWSTQDTPVSSLGPIASGMGMSNTQAQQLLISTQQIADQDYNISINHGQSIFSVKGKVLT